MKNEPMICQLEDVDWQSAEEHPGLRWKFLVDADYTPSRGLSFGSLEVEVGAKLPPHTHAPQEIYFVHSGCGTVRLGDTAQSVGVGSVIYIPENCRHGIENTGTETLGFYWIFPTDTWSEVEYFFDPA